VFSITPSWSDPAANANFAAAKILGPLIAQYGLPLALDYYNSNQANPKYTTQSTWNTGDTVDYATSVLRHQKRINDFKAVCDHD
jgi:hypothetical protein